MAEHFDDTITQNARTLMQRAVERDPTHSLCVGFSDGKDARVCLHLARQAIDAWRARNPNAPPTHGRLHAFAMYIVPGLRVFEKNMPWFEQKYGCTITYVPHWKLSDWYRFSLFRTPTIETEKYRALSIKDIEAHLRRKLNVDWFVYGHRMTDSLERRGMLHKVAGFDEKTRRVYPLWRWNERDVYAFLRPLNMPAIQRYGSKGHTSGLAVDAPTLLFLKEHYPDDYEKMMRAFPGAGVLMFRDKMRKDREHAEENRRQRTVDAIRANPAAAGAGEAIRKAPRSDDPGR